MSTLVRFFRPILIILVIGVIALRLFPYLLGLLSSVDNVPVGINEQKALQQNFQINHMVLQSVVNETLQTKVTSVRRGYWSLGGYRRPYPEGEFYNKLYEAMRRARIQEVHVYQENLSIITLITDEIPRGIDTDYYGYIWVKDQKEVETSGYRGLYGGYWLDDHWYLFQHTEG